MATHHIKGGYARAAKLSPARRNEIAVKAAKTRWRKYRRALKKLAAMVGPAPTR